MFSQTVEYALRAVVYLAGQGTAPRTSEQIAQSTRVPQSYLSKVLQQLAENGLINSQRGPRGGFVLARSADVLTILEVVAAVDPICRIKTCPLGLASHGVQLCPLHKRVDDALAEVERAFGATTFAEVLADPNPSIPLCEFPPTTPIVSQLPAP